VIDWFPCAPDRPTHAAPFFSDGDLADVRAFYADAKSSPPTPLRSLRGLASQLGLAGVLAKDESMRFGLPAFKILGARYALARLVAERAGRGGALTDVACATAGNHGRAVSRAAKAHGLTSHVYVPAGTAQARIAALAAEGADVVVSDVGYDETVRRMARDAGTRGWTIVSDTAWEGYEQIPFWIMAGYTQLMNEAARQWGDARPDIVIAQAGVGSLAGAVAGYLDQVRRIGEQSALRAVPSLVVAEPIGSACVLASLRAGRRVTLDSAGPTEMVGLRCAEVSPLAWRALEPVVDAAIAVPDELTHEAMRLFANPVPGDSAVHAGASGAAGLAALVALVSDASLAPLRASLRLNSKARAMVIVTEAPTG
jgi:diaminopropionate ammonia-lyase